MTKFLEVFNVIVLIYGIALFPKNSHIALASTSRLTFNRMAPLVSFILLYYFIMTLSSKYFDNF